MSAPAASVANPPFNRANSSVSDSGSESGEANGGRRALQTHVSQFQQNMAENVPSSANLSRPAGNLLKGATDDEGNLKAPALLVGLKLDLEAEIHLSARIRGDITIGLY